MVHNCKNKKHFLPIGFKKKLEIESNLTMNVKKFRIKFKINLSQSQN